MTRPRVIGLAGKAGSGKDTVASLLTRHLKGSTRTYALADPVKITCAMAFMVPLETFYSEDKTKIIEPWGISIREALIMVGTTFFREGYRDDVWLQHCQKVFDTCTADTLIITDVRRGNEEAWVLDNWGVLLYVTGRSTESIDHITETHQELAVNTDMYIRVDNSGSLEELDARVRQLAEKISRG